MWFPIIGPGGGVYSTKTIVLFRNFYQNDDFQSFHCFHRWTDGPLFDLKRLSLKGRLLWTLKVYKRNTSLIPVSTFLGTCLLTPSVCSTVPKQDTHLTSFTQFNRLLFLLCFLGRGHFLWLRWQKYSNVPSCFTSLRLGGFEVSGPYFSHPPFPPLSVSLCRNPYRAGLVPLFPRQMCYHNGWTPLNHRRNRTPFRSPVVRPLLLLPDFPSDSLCLRVSLPISPSPVPLSDLPSGTVLWFDSVAIIRYITQINITTTE